MSKYRVYRNDLKFKNHRQIDPNCAVWTKKIKNSFVTYNTDGIDYRIYECIQENSETIDLSHMTLECFEEFITHLQFKNIRDTIQHIFAESSNLTIIPNLHKFKNLITLDLSNNKLTNIQSLPETLEELILDNNRLISFTHNLPNLKRLKISNNNISEIKLNNSLESIYLNNNPIDNINYTHNIKYLNISNTYIKSIYSYPKLEILECHHTKIKYIPKMDTLKELNCSFSPVSDISKLNNIESLEIINTHIKNIHYMNSLCIIIYNRGDIFKLSNKYIISGIKQNKNDKNVITFHT